MYRHLQQMRARPSGDEGKSAIEVNKAEGQPAREHNHRRQCRLGASHGPATTTARIVEPDGLMVIQPPLYARCGITMAAFTTV